MNVQENFLLPKEQLGHCAPGLDRFVVWDGQKRLSGGGWAVVRINTDGGACIYQKSSASH
jgi:hypothetical protein